MADLLNTLQFSLQGQYDVQRQLGEGGMATVYLATDKKHGREVAIKVLKPDLAASVGHERFLREIEIAAKLQHPHILPVYDSGEAEGLLYYVMPYVAGESLRDRMSRDGVVSTEDAVQIAREVAAALDYAHTQGIVHRDIKPANILLSQGHAQVADFGIARAISVSGGAGLTQAGMAVGTPWYMAPEQSLGETDVDGRADVYALGCVLFEMLAGKPPYEGPTPQSVIAKSLSGDIPELEVDEFAMQSVIARAMAKEKTDRFQTARELEVALRAPATVRVPAAAQPRRLVIGVAAALLMLVAGAFALWPRGANLDGDPRKSLVIFPFENKTGDPANDYLQEASMNLIGLAVSHWEDLRVFDDERTGSLLRRYDIAAPSDIDFDRARDMAREARVGTLILGDIRQERDSLAVEAKVHDVQSGDRVATEILRAPLDADPRPLFDSLAARILHVSGAPPGERPELITQTTRSLDAYRAYLTGMDHLQRFEIQAARAALERAIELDSTFALAYIGLSNVDGWAGIESDPARRRVWIAKAGAHSASLPTRLKLLVQYHSAYVAGQLGRARAVAEELIRRDSTDVEAWYQLGEAHYHDRRPRDSIPEDAPNHGKGLHAFRRTVSLDPSYVLAYQHITDALGACVNVTRILCVADSAVYGDPDELNAMFGEDEVRRLRDEAREARVTAAYDWVTASPTSLRARSRLLAVLIDERRYDEAARQVELMRVESPEYAAQLWNGYLHYQQADYATAAANTEDAVAAGQQAFTFFFREFEVNNVLYMLVSGARLEVSRNLIDQVLAFVPGDSISGPLPMQITKPVFSQLLNTELAAFVGNDAELAHRATNAWLDTLQTLYGDADGFPSVWASGGSIVLSTYLASRDTTLLSRFLASVDTSGSRTWRTMQAHLALARGDTTTAHRRLAAHYDQADELEFLSNPGVIRLYGWADLFAQLGQYQRAVEAYTLMDSLVAGTDRGALHVRSWAERGALYQQLGQTDQAIEMYEKFIVAWKDADDSVQPMVDRARASVASLRGETAATERR